MAGPSMPPTSGRRRRASAEVAAALECSPGDPVLRIDRLYFDEGGDLLELAVNHFNPERYTYRFQMRATD